MTALADTILGYCIILMPVAVSVAGIAFLVGCDVADDIARRTRRKQEAQR